MARGLKRDRRRTFILWVAVTMLLLSCGNHAAVERDYSSITEIYVEFSADAFDAADKANALFTYPNTDPGASPTEFRLLPGVYGLSNEKNDSTGIWGTRIEFFPDATAAQKKAVLKTAQDAGYELTIS